MLLQNAELPLQQRFKAHMMSILAMQCDTEHAKGCYLVLCQSEIISGNIPDDAAEMLARTDALSIQLYAALFTESPEAIALGLDAHAQENALALYTLSKGTTAMARSGAELSQLEYAVDSMLAGIFQCSSKLCVFSNFYCRIYPPWVEDRVRVTFYTNGIQTAFIGTKHIEGIT